MIISVPFWGIYFASRYETGGWAGSHVKAPEATPLRKMSETVAQLPGSETRSWPRPPIPRPLRAGRSSVPY